MGLSCGLGFTDREVYGGCASEPPFKATPKTPSKGGRRRWGCPVVWGLPPGKCTVDVHQNLPLRPHLKNPAKGAVDDGVVLWFGVYRQGSVRWMCIRTSL